MGCRLREQQLWHSCCQHLPCPAICRGDTHSPPKTGISGFQLGMSKSQTAEHRRVLNCSLRNTKGTKHRSLMFPWKKEGFSVCRVLPAVFHNQGLKPASPFLPFEQMALHYRKSCQFKGGILHRGGCHLLMSSDYSVVRSVNLSEQKRRVPAGDWISSLGCRHLAWGGALCGSLG